MGIKAHNKDMKPIAMQTFITKKKPPSCQNWPIIRIAVAAFASITCHKSLAHWSPDQERIYIHNKDIVPGHKYMQKSELSDIPL